MCKYDMESFLFFQVTIRLSVGNSNRAIFIFHVVKIYLHLKTLTIRFVIQCNSTGLNNR